MLEIPNQPIQPQTSPVGAQPSGFNWKKVLIVVLIGAALIAIVVGVYYHLYGFKSPSTGNNQIEIKKATSSAKPATPSAQKDETVGWKTFNAATGDFKFDYPPTLFYGADMGEGIYYGGSFVSNKLEAEGGNSCEGKTDCFVLGFQGWRYGLIDSPDDPYHLPVPDPSTTTWGKINNLPVGGSTVETIGTVSMKHTRREDFSVNNLVWLRYDSEKQGESQYELKYLHSLHTKKGNYYYEFSISSDFEFVITQNKRLLERIISTFKFLD